MSNPFVSVIVPVYNVERYLPRCIESILNQTYTNFELILIDDGTPDRSGIICDRYAERDARIRVIHKENGGVSSARNAGIDIAQGKWITFVDSDDWVTDDYLKVLVDPLFEGCDLTVGLLEYRYFTISQRTCKELLISRENANDSEIFETMCKMEFSGPTSKLFLKSLICDNQLRFPEDVAVAEDAIFVKKYIRYCQKIYMTGKVIYCYNRLNELSVTRRIPYFRNRTKWDDQYINTYIETFTEWGVKDDFIKQEISRRAIFLFLNNVQSIIYAFPKEEALLKIIELKNVYIKWIDLEPNSFKLQSEEQKLLLDALIKNDANFIYNYANSSRKSKIITSIKKISKKIIGFIIEKYRDKVVKFKF